MIRSIPKLTAYVGGEPCREETECIFLLSGIAQQDAPLVCDLLTLIVNQYDTILTALHDGEGGIIIAS